MKFSSLTNEQKASAIRELMIYSDTYSDTKPYFSSHPELKDEEAGLFALSQAVAAYQHFKARGEQQHREVAFALSSAGFLIGNEIGNNEIISSAALFLSNLWKEVGNYNEAKRYEEIAQNRKSLTQSHSNESAKFKDLPSKQQDELIIPLIDLVYDKSKNFGNDYLYAHPILLHEDVVYWALNIANHDFLIYQRNKNKDAFKVAKNLCMVAFAISVEIHNKDLVLSALDLLSKTYTEAGMRDDARYWKQMADEYRRR